MGVLDTHAGQIANGDLFIVAPPMFSTRGQLSQLDDIILWRDYAGLQGMVQLSKTETLCLTISGDAVNAGEHIGIDFLFIFGV